MTDASEPAPSTAAPTNALGVVDPLRIPGLERALAYLRGLPTLAKAFVGLAVLDTVARAMGFLGQSLDIELGIPLTLFTAFLPHTALILLPAIIVARRPDAARSVPLVLRGAIAIALIELLIAPISIAAESVGGLPAWATASIAGHAGMSAAWVAIALGLAALRAGRPSAAAAGYANLVAGTIALGAITSVGVLVLLQGYDYGDPAWNALAKVAGAATAISTFALAFLARVVIRGVGDPERPGPATTTAAVAASLWGLNWLLILGVNVAAIMQTAFAWPTGAVAGMLTLGWVGNGLATGALVLAFALGLADRARDPGATPASVPDDGPAWPAPGREVPTYR